MAKKIAGNEAWRGNRLKAGEKWRREESGNRVISNGEKRKITKSIAVEK
jgi:hypothetical protein